MPTLNRANSGVASKRSRLKAGCVSRALVFPLSLRPSAMLGNLRFTDQLLVSQSTPDDLTHPDHDAGERRPSRDG